MDAVDTIVEFGECVDVCPGFTELVEIVED